MDAQDLEKMIRQLVEGRHPFNHSGYYNLFTDQIEDDYDIERIRMTEDMFNKISPHNSENPVEHVESINCDCMKCNQWTIADFTENVDYIKED